MSEQPTTPEQRATLERAQDVAKRAQDVANCSAILAHTVAHMSRIFGPMTTMGALLAHAGSQLDLVDAPPAARPFDGSDFA